MRPLQNSIRLASALTGLLVCLGLTCHAEQGPAPAVVSACFTPGPESCAELIADKIEATRSKVSDPHPAMSVSMIGTCSVVKPHKLISVIRTLAGNSTERVLPRPGISGQGRSAP